MSKSTPKTKKNISRAIMYFLSAVFLIFSIYFFATGFLSEPPSVEETDYDLDIVEADISPESLITYDINEMYAQNKDFKGWIMIPDTNINFPVVQGKDNDFYLTHGFSGQYSVYGCPFLEYDAKTTDKNKVIHGHNMGSKSDKIFSTLVNYNDASFAETHKYIYFSEPDVEGQMYELYAVMNYNTAMDHPINYRTKNFSSDEEYDTFVKYLKEHAVYANPDYTPDDTDLLILSTCYRKYGEDNRLIICAGKKQES